MDRDRQRTDPSRPSQPYPATSSGSYRGSYAPQPSSSAYLQQPSGPSSRSRQSPPTTPGDRYAGYPSTTRTSPRLNTDVYAGGGRRAEVPVGIGALPQNDPYWVAKRNAPQTTASPYGQDPYGSNKFQNEEDDDYPDQRSEYSTKGFAAGRNSDGSSYRKSGNPTQSYGQGSEDYRDHDEVYGHGTNKKVTPNPDNYYNSGEYHVGRANSYLPYSHYKHQEASYGDNDALPNYNSPSDGAHLRDGKPMIDDAPYDIAMDNLDPNPNADSESVHYRDSDYPPIKSSYSNPSAPPTPSLPTTTKKRSCRCCCGLRRRTCVFVSFGICAVIIVIAFFCWPRIPIATINSASLVDGPYFGSNTAPSIKADWIINFQIDNRDSFIPIKFGHISAIATDASTLVQIGSGSMYDVSFSGRSMQTINFPIAIDYATLQYTDPTWQDLYKACGPQKAGQAIALPISFTITFELYLLAWTGYKPSVVATPSGNFACPGA